MSNIVVCGIGTDVGKTVVSSILVEKFKCDYCDRQFTSNSVYEKHKQKINCLLDDFDEEEINILAISTSEIKTSVVIDEKYMELAVRALHKAFDLDQA